jgi:hypothetical protein
MVNVIVFFTISTKTSLFSVVEPKLVQDGKEILVSDVQFEKH